MSRIQLFLRGLLFQTGWNRERMQGLGFAFALLPQVQRRDRKAQAEFVRRHLAYVNTNPALSGVLLGAVETAEERAWLAGDSSDEVTARVTGLKRRLEGGLAALGDRTFWGWLRPLLGVLGALLLFWPGHGGSAVARFMAQPTPKSPLAGGEWWAWASVLAALAFYNGPHLVTRWRAVGHGLAFSRGEDRDRARAARGFGLVRIADFCESLGPLLLGALAGRIGAEVVGQAATTSAGGGAGAALLVAGVSLGLGAARFRIPPERVGIIVLGFLLVAGSWR